jgi:hypothetical protein
MPRSLTGCGGTTVTTGDAGTGLAVARDMGSKKRKEKLILAWAFSAV